MKKPLSAMLGIMFFVSLSTPAWSQMEPAETSLPTDTQMDSESIFPQCTTDTGILVNIQPVSLKSSYISKKFDGYEVSITNSNENDVAVTQANITNGFEGEEVSEEIRKSLIGVTSFLGVGGFVTTAVRRKIKNNKALDEAQGFDNFIYPAVLNQGESVSTRALLKKNDEPQLNLTVTDQETGQVLCQTSLTTPMANQEPEAQLPAESVSENQGASSPSESPE